MDFAEHLVTLYPALMALRSTLAEMGPALAPIQAPVGTVLFNENALCQGFPLVLQGEIKVSRSSVDGHQPNCVKP